MKPDEDVTDVVDIDGADVEGSEDEETPASEPELSDREAAIQASLSFVPVQDAPRTSKNALTVKRGPGRPRKVERAPTVSDLQYHAIMAQKRQDFIKSDPLVKVLEDGKADVLDVLTVIKKEIAVETASLTFERLENEKRGRDTGQLSTRRIEALKKVAEIELKIKEIDGESVNLSSERMQKVFALWVEVMRESATEIDMPEELLNLFFNRFATKMEGWEERAANGMR